MNEQICTDDILQNEIINGGVNTEAVTRENKANEKYKEEECDVAKQDTKTQHKDEKQVFDIARPYIEQQPNGTQHNSPYKQTETTH